MKQFVTIAAEHAVTTIDAMALLVIVFGTIQAFVAAVWLAITPSDGHERRDIWLRYARWLVAGLTFQLAADIIESSVITTWESIIRLGFIAVIRTFLNYFLERDLNEVRGRQRESLRAP